MIFCTKFPLIVAVSSSLFNQNSVLLLMLIVKSECKSSKLFLCFILQEEDLYEIEIPLRFTASVGARVHGLACWFDVLFNGR